MNVKLGSKSKESGLFGLKKLKMTKLLIISLCFLCPLWLYSLRLCVLVAKAPRNLRNLRLINDLRAYKYLYNCREDSTTIESSLQINLFMQNKANFQKVKLNVSPVNKANSKPIKANSKPIQTQFKPNFPAHAGWPIKLMPAEAAITQILLHFFPYPFSLFTFHFSSSHVGPKFISTFSGTSSLIAPAISCSIHFACSSASEAGSSKTNSSCTCRINFTGKSSFSIFL